MDVVIGLGSNLAQPLQQLRRACQQLQQIFTITAYSNIYQSSALVPEGAPKDWAEKSYLNAAIKISTHLTPVEVLTHLKKIEANMGRNADTRWAPRIIDLDILIFGTLELHSQDLHIPHQELPKRPFALLPLWDVLPEYQHPKFPHLTRTAVEKTAQIKKLPHLLAGPQMVGILNVTPDSFADGGKYITSEAALAQAQKLFEEGADIIDIGAESTRPVAPNQTKAELINTTLEWQRLEPVLTGLKHLWAHDLRPIISIDTRHAATLEKALAFNIDWLNDVSQEEFAQFQPILQAHPHLKYVTMHHLGVPRDDAKIIQGDPIHALIKFKQTWQEQFNNANLSENRLIFDPGIGFGKSVMQQLAIINRFNELKSTGGLWLVGHSRKSFLRGLLPNPNEESKESATALISAHLATQKVDYLRVHAPESNLAAIRLNKFLSST